MLAVSWNAMLAVSGNAMLAVGWNAHYVAEAERVGWLHEPETLSRNTAGHHALIPARIAGKRTYLSQKGSQLYELEILRIIAQTLFLLF